VRVECIRQSQHGYSHEGMKTAVTYYKQRFKDTIILSPLGQAAAILFLNIFMTYREEIRIIAADDSPCS
jgi:hypothetical protein